MNKIFKVIYSKTKHMYVVASELAKSHSKSKNEGATSGKALAALVMAALASVSFMAAPMTAEADTYSNNMVGINHYYYKKDKDGNLVLKEAGLPWLQNNSQNWDGKGATAEGTPGAITIGMDAVSGKDTITIGDRNALQSTQSVFIGSNYDADHQTKPQTGNNLVVVGYEADATGNGSIAIGSGASADPWKNISDTNPANANKSGNSVALGYKAQAENNNIAIGANSVATDAASKTAALYTSQTAAKSYVSVGTSDVLRRITNVADGAADTDVATIAQLKKVADNKVAWKLTTAGDNNNASTVSAGDTVDFSAAKDSKTDGKAGNKDHSNLTISKENGTNKVNMTVGLSDNVILGQNASGNGGSLDVYRAVGDASSDKETSEHNQSYDQLGSHVRIDGSTVSVHYDNGTDSDARGAVMGIANDSYKDTNDATKTVSSPLGYVYLQDGKNYYYLHGAMHGDTNYQGRLAYDSSESGYNYIANLDDGLKFTGDTENTTVETKLDPNAANNILSIKGGVTDSGKLTSGNIGVVATANTTDEKGNVTSAGGLTIQLAKDLTGITSITSQTTGSTTGAKVTLDTKDNNIDVNQGKVTNLSDGTVNAESTDAVTGKQLYNLDNSSVKYDTTGTKVDKTKITLAGGATGTTITNVKAGTISANSTDAVNGAQLYAEQQARAQDKTKYYSVHEGPQIADFSTNENNDGASAWAGLAAGYETGTAGIGSTVVGSYSGVMNTGTTSSVDLRGAASISLGTLNLNQNTDTSKTFSGVANSIVGQGNMTTNSNAAIILGAGNIITDSYRGVTIDTSKMKTYTPEELKDALQKAVPNSGAQVMAIGGGNKITSAYKTQVVGVGNTVSNTELNYVDGFNNTVTNGKSNYIIGAKNTLDSGNNNVIFGDNHKLSSKSNNVIIGSADDENKELTASNAVVIGHNADVSVDGGVALGSGSVSTATDEEDAEGYDPVSTVTNKASTNTSATWKATTGAVSIGGVNGNTTTTRRITNLAAGFNDTDAVNVAQIKKLANIDASNIGTNLKGSDSKTAATTDEQNTNENAWGAAIGTGKIADPDASDKETNGSQQLVTGGTVYKALNGGMTKIVIGTPGENGKDGAPGTIGLVGPAGTNGKDGAVDITIQKGKDDDAKGIKGANGVDGKDGITRIVYTDAAGDHQAATMEDGMKFAGDDGQTSADKVIAKKLNNTIDIIGGADSKKLTDKNIGVNNVGGKLKIQLAQNLTGITSIGNQKTTGEGKDATTTGAKITLDDNDKNISVNGGSIKEVASNLKDGKLIDGSANNAASISDVQTLVQQGVDNGYTNGDGITIQKDSTSGKNVISVNKGDGLKFNNNHELVVNTGDGLEIADGAVKIKAADNNFKISSNGIGLSDIVTIGTNKSTQVTIDGTKGEISGLSNTTWGKPADYSNSTKAATESQVAQAMSAAIDQAGQNDVDTHVEAGTYAVGTITTDDGKTEQGVSLAIVDKSGKTTNTKVVITDVAKASDVGDVSKLADGVKNADGSTTTVVNAINNVNTKIGDQKYSTSNTSGSNKYVNDGDSITSAIGKLDGAVQNAAEQAGKHSIVSVAEGEKNISVKNIAKEGEAANYQISLNKDLNVTSVTATTVTTDTLNANSATIGGDKGITIKDNTVSGLKDTEIKEGSTNAVNGNTIWKELRPTADGSYIKKNSTTAQNLVSLDTQVKKTADLINSDGSTIKIGGSDTATKIDISGKDSGGSTTARIITGVQTDAQDATSAANVGYVNDVAAANTQQIYRDMHSAYGHLNNNINKAAAGSNALAALHPLDYDPADKASYAVGYGHYRNANAAAVGAFYQPNANTMVSVGVSMGNGDPGVNAGVSFKVGKGSAYNGVSKAQMAETIAAQEKQISEIKASDVAKDQRIDSLEKENQEMKKQIQEILAKLGK